jgi:hypothetical protein
MLLIITNCDKGNTLVESTNVAASTNVLKHKYKIKLVTNVIWSTDVETFLPKMFHTHHVKHYSGFGSLFNHQNDGLNPQSRSVTTQIKAWRTDWVMKWGCEFRTWVYNTRTPLADLCKVVSLGKSNLFAHTTMHIQARYLHPLITLLGDFSEINHLWDAGNNLSPDVALFW